MAKSILATFKQYAEAFEDALDDNDWARLKPYFSDSAVYLPGDGKTIAGCDSIISFLRDSVDSLDRKFDRREFAEPPEFSLTDEAVTMTFVINYTKEGLPDLNISGHEIATFKSGVIHRLEDVLDKQTVQQLGEWLKQFGDQLL